MHIVARVCRVPLPAQSFTADVKDFNFAHSREQQQLLQCLLYILCQQLAKLHSLAARRE